MSKELVFLLIAVIDIVTVFIASRLGREWLLGTVALNLILVGIFGAKLAPIFGFVTNAGNIFYACVFLATYFLLENYGRREGMKTFWYGAAAITLFILLSQLVVRLSGSEDTMTVNDSSQVLFSFAPRVFFASIVAYFFAQSVNVGVYEWMRSITKGRHLWLRSNVANIIGQVVDSSIFFTIAFIDLSGPLLLQTILVGGLVKIVVVALGTPLLYLGASERQGSK